MNENVYTENGYNDRKDYLDTLADMYGDIVYELAAVLGENEDFDGLVNVGYKVGYNIKSIISEKVLLLKVLPAGILGSSPLGKSVGVGVEFV